MSYGQVIRVGQLLSRTLSLGKLEGFALALKDRRSKAMKGYDERNNIGVVEGDIMSPGSWKLIEAELRKIGEKVKFDIIFCRPLGALKNIPPNPLSKLPSGNGNKNSLIRKAGDIRLAADEIKVLSYSPKAFFIRFCYNLFLSFKYTSKVSVG